MTPLQIRNARAEIGRLWKLGRDLRSVELGRLLHLASARPGNTVRLWERGLNNIPGPTARVIEAMLAGWRPNDWQERMKPDRMTQRGERVPSLMVK